MGAQYKEGGRSRASAIKGPILLALPRSEKESFRVNNHIPNVRIGMEVSVAAVNGLYSEVRRVETGRGPVVGGL
eukprot:759327-Hanusia_phi.AAC.1